MKIRLRRTNPGLIVKASPPGQSEVGWKMKPGDAVRVEWPPAEMVIRVDGDGVVIVTGSEGEA